MSEQRRLTMRQYLQVIVEKFTGRKCENCKYNNGIFCDSPKRGDCTNNIFPVGFEPKEGE